MFRFPCFFCRCVLYCVWLVWLVLFACVGCPASGFRFPGGCAVASSFGLSGSAFLASLVPGSAASRSAGFSVVGGAAVSVPGGAVFPLAPCPGCGGLSSCSCPPSGFGRLSFVPPAVPLLPALAGPSSPASLPSPSSFFPVSAWVAPLPSPPSPAPAPPSFAPPVSSPLWPACPRPCPWPLRLRLGLAFCRSCSASSLPVSPPPLLLPALAGPSSPSCPGCGGAGPARAPRVGSGRSLFCPSCRVPSAPLAPGSRLFPCSCPPGPASFLPAPSPPSASAVLLAARASGGLVAFRFRPGRSGAAFVVVCGFRSFACASAFAPVGARLAGRSVAVRRGSWLRGAWLVSVPASPPARGPGLPWLRVPRLLSVASFVSFLGALGLVSAASSFPVPRSPRGAGAPPSLWGGPFRGRLSPPPLPPGACAASAAASLARRVGPAPSWRPWRFGPAGDAGVVPPPAGFAVSPGGVGRAADAALVPPAAAFGDAVRVGSRAEVCGPVVRAAGFAVSGAARA